MAPAKANETEGRVYGQLISDIAFTEPLLTTEEEKEKEYVLHSSQSVDRTAPCMSNDPSCSWSLVDS